MSCSDTSRGGPSPPQRTCAIFLPIVKSLGYDPVWFGVLFNINMQIAYLSPPFGGARRRVELSALGVEMHDAALRGFVFEPQRAPQFAEPGPAVEPERGDFARVAARPAGPAFVQETQAPDPQGGVGAQPDAGAAAWRRTDLRLTAVLILIVGAVWVFFR